MPSRIAPSAGSPTFPSSPAGCSRSACAACRSARNPAGSRAPERGRRDRRARAGPAARGSSSTTASTWRGCRVSACIWGRTTFRPPPRAPSWVRRRRSASPRTTSRPPAEPFADPAVDYVAFGPIYESATKSGRAPRGLEELARVAAAKTEAPRGHRRHHGRTPRRGVGRGGRLGGDDRRAPRRGPDRGERAARARPGAPADPPPAGSISSASWRRARPRSGSGSPRGSGCRSWTSTPRSSASTGQDGPRPLRGVGGDGLSRARGGIPGGNRVAPGGGHRHRRGELRRARGTGERSRGSARRSFSTGLWRPCTRV